MTVTTHTNLFQETKRICARLASRGWRELMLKHGLDLKAQDLRKELVEKKLTVDREQPGFEDCNPSMNRGIQPGSFSRSLLYHALASPAVHLRQGPSSDPRDYPTLQELDTIENYIFSLVADRDDLAGAVLAVFAYQYRVSKRSSHGAYADMAYSRTGVARVGTANANYQGFRRSHWVNPDGGNGLCVLPARYGVFLARPARRGDHGMGSVLRGAKVNGPYLFPIHKVFEGPECIAGRDFSIEYVENHINEKLRRLHTPQIQGLSGLERPPGFDVDRTPFSRHSRNGGNLVALEEQGSSTLVTPVPRPNLIEIARQNGKVACFEVRPGAVGTSLASLGMATGPSDTRPTPEFVNARHKVDRNDLNTVHDLGEEHGRNVLSKMTEGNYLAAHFIDYTCDGCLEAVVGDLNGPDTVARAAFSLVTAPDFFPLADQSELFGFPDPENTPTALVPLSDGSHPPNLALASSVHSGQAAFDTEDNSLVAVVGSERPTTTQRPSSRRNIAVSFLPDSASNLFAPGWDVTRVMTDTFSVHYSSAGLGSPFPEDAKLCAALSAYWPAVSPDTARTFGNEKFINYLPMLDSELGYHPEHRKVLQAEVSSYRGWDGEFGPALLESGGQKFVDFADFDVSDYIRNALRGLIRVDLTSEVTTEDLQRRAVLFARARRALNSTASGLDLSCLVEFESVPDWASEQVAQLVGPGFRMLFVELRDELPSPDSFRRRRKIGKFAVAQAADNGTTIELNGSGQVRFFPAV